VKPLLAKNGARRRQQLSPPELGENVFFGAA